jgi:AraC family transcriptional activator of pobA
MPRSRLTDSLYDPRKGDPPLRLSPFSLNSKPSEPARTNCFSIYWIKSGSGLFWADAAVHRFSENSLLFLVPYQHIRFEPDGDVRGEVIQFHANFLCVETFHAEVGCSSILFNDPYSAPVVNLDKPLRQEVGRLMERMQREQAERGLAFEEVVLASLRVLLILATRLKSASFAACLVGGIHARHPVLENLRELIEQNFNTLHAPSDYAALLHMTPKTLGRIVREELGKTLTDLIRERILTHAKWQLLHTLRPVKEIALAAGFRDELYFSRLFKKATGLSPTFFREFETEIRKGSNLSMFSSHAPIQASRGEADNSGIARASPDTGTENSH